MIRQLLLNQHAGLFFQPQKDVLLDLNHSEDIMRADFWVFRGTKLDIEIILTSKYLGARQKEFCGNSFVAYTPLCFELKFEVIYQNEILGKVSENSIYSKKLGVRLIRQGCKTLDLWIKSEGVIDLWIKYLGRKISQYGFHQMYRPLKKLGKGGFATVYEVERMTDRHKFAVKAFSKQNTINSDVVNNRLNLVNEINILKKFDNTNVIRLEGIYQSDNSIYLVFELLNAGQLHSRINRQVQGFSINQIKNFMVGLIRGLKHMHDMNIIHRDIKPENLMLRSSDDLEPVIIDFGLAVNVDANDYIFYRCGTPGYVAPQILQLQRGQKVKTKCDIFSAGVIFHILLTKRPLFEGKKFQQVFLNNKLMNFNLNHERYASLDVEAYDLLTKMLRVDPGQRLSADQVLNHNFLYNTWQEKEEAQKILSPNPTGVSIRPENYFLYQ